MVDIVGIAAVKDVIKQARFHRFLIHETRPAFKELQCITPSIWDATNADNQEDAALKFEQWATTVLNSNPNNHKVYYLHMGLFKEEATPGKRPQYNPTICAFVLQGHTPGTQFNGTNHTIHSGNQSFPPGGQAASDSEPTRVFSHIPTNEAELYKIKLELERAKWENEQLRASILEEDDEEDDEEESDILEEMFSGDESNPSPLKDALGKILTKFAEDFTKPKPEEQVINAFNRIHKAAPDAPKLLIKLGEIAEQNPAQIQEFINQILNTLNTSSNDKEN